MSDTADILAKLRDIKEPPPPDTVAPLLPVITVLMLTLLLLFFLYRLWMRKNAFKATLIQELNDIKRSDDNEKLLILAQLLRRTMYCVHGSEMNTLEGQEWLSSLDKTFNTRFFSEGDGRVFGENLYTTSAASNQNIPQLIAQLQKQIHRVKFNRKGMQHPQRPTPVQYLER